MLSSADSQAAAAEDDAEDLPAEVAMDARCGVGRNDGVRWYISTALRRISSFLFFWRLVCCLERAELDEDEATGLADEDAEPLREMCAALLCEKARVAPLCKFRMGADMS